MNDFKSLFIVEKALDCELDGIRFETNDKSIYGREYIPKVVYIWGIFGDSNCLGNRFTIMPVGGKVGFLRNGIEWVGLRVD